MLITALLGLTLAHAAPRLPAEPSQIAPPESAQPMAPFQPISPMEHNLRTAKDLRTTGVVLSLAGPPVFVVGAFALLIDALQNEGPGVVSTSLLLIGASAMVAGPPVTMVGGYYARKVVKAGSSEGTLPGLAAAAWASHAMSLGYGLTYPASVGLSWGWTNTMIQRADRALYVEAQGIPDQGHPVYVRLQPTYDKRNNRLGLRLDAAF